MKRLLLIALLFSSGCTQLLESTPPECADSLECPIDEFCVDGTCVYEAPTVVTDASADTSHDAGALSDLSVAPNRAPHYPDERCFEGSNGAVIGTTASNEIPRGYCSKWGILWTESESGHQTLVINDGPDDQSPTRLPRISGRVEIAKSEVLVARFNEIEQAINIWRHHLTTGVGEFIKPSSRDQSRPSRGLDFTAFTERDSAGKEAVLVHFDDGTIQSCAVEGRHQSGVIAGDTWVAWIEYRAAIRTGRVVIAPAANCAAPNLRRERVLLGAIPRGEGLYRAGEELVWLMRPRSGPNELRRWMHRRRGAEPETHPLDTQRGNPVEIESRGDWVSIVHYRDLSPRFVLEVVNLARSRTLPISTTGNVHQPILTENYVIWAQGGGATGWEVRYEALE